MRRESEPEVPEDTPEDRRRAREYVDKIQKRLQRHFEFEPDELARRLLDERPPMASLGALVALEDKLLKNQANVRSPNCLLTTLLSAQNTRRELGKERSLSEMLERCDGRERSVVSKLDRIEQKKMQDDLQSNGANITGNLPAHIAGRIFTLVKEGTPLSQLKDVYRNRYREEFEIKRWGFSKVTQLLQSIPGLNVSKLPDGRNQMTVHADDAAFHAAIRGAGGEKEVPSSSPTTRTAQAQRPAPARLAAKAKPGQLSCATNMVVNAWAVRQLCDMGFEAADARQALEQTHGDVAAAIELLTNKALEPPEPSVLPPPKTRQPRSPQRLPEAQVNAVDLLPQEQAARILEQMRRGEFRMDGDEPASEDPAVRGGVPSAASLAAHMQSAQTQTAQPQAGQPPTAAMAVSQTPSAALPRVVEEEADEPREGQIIAVEKKFESTDDRQLSLALGDQVQLVSRDPSGWTYGRIVSGVREGHEGWFPHYVGKPAKMKPKPQFPPPPPESPPEHEVTLAKVTNVFVSSERNQLSLEKGDNVEIVDQHPNGWTYCRLPGTAREGWFPQNFLCKVEAEA